MSCATRIKSILTVRFGNTFQFILLLDGVRGRRTLSSVHQFFSQTFSNRLDVSERSFSSTDGQQSNSLVNSSQWRDIDSLSSDGTGRTNSGGIFSWTGVDNSVNNDLQWVGVGDNVDDFQSVLDDSDGLQFLTVVSTVHHQGVGQSFNDWTLSLSESLGSVSTSSVGDKDWLSDLNVISQRDVLDGNVLEGPFVEQLDFAGTGLDVSWDWGSQLNELDLNWFRNDFFFVLLFNDWLVFSVRHLDV